jgi:hypothetical protein
MELICIQTVSKLSAKVVESAMETPLKIRKTEGDAAKTAEANAWMEMTKANLEETVDILEESKCCMDMESFHVKTTKAILEEMVGEDAQFATMKEYCKYKSMVKAYLEGDVQYLDEKACGCSQVEEQALKDVKDMQKALESTASSSKECKHEASALKFEMFTGGLESDSD